MEIKEIASQEIWDEFFNALGSPTFLQSWEWGELQKGQKYDVVRLGMYRKDTLQVIAQIIKIKAKRGNLIFLPHGPIGHQVDRKVIHELKDYLVGMAKTEGYHYVRISPILQDSPENRKLYQSESFRKAPIYMHAENIWVLPLVKTEDELLADMRKTTRYLIRKAVKDQVTIEKISKHASKKELDIFWDIYHLTAVREGFTPFSRKFIEREFDEFNKTGNALFLLGKAADNQYLGAALIIFTKSTGFYHQGASIHSKIPVMYLLQWEAIKEAKKRGCITYNFWGIDPSENPKHAWYGLSMFKKGFSGHQIDYVPTQDYVVSPRYYLSSIYEKLLRWKRKV